jgi:eukaryotic-like serine/threonine-protein kinase
MTAVIATLGPSAALAARLPLYGAAMSNQRNKIIQPRVQTPLPGAPVRTATTRLPDDLLSEHIQRLAVAGAVGAGLWLFGFVMDTIVFPLTVGPAPRTLTVVIDILGVLVSAGMFVCIRHMAGAPQTKADVGLLFMVLNAIFVALVNSQARTVTAAAMGHVSWNTIVILVGSMILPTTPRKMLVASVVAASMDPLGVWIAHLRGIPVPSLVNTFVLFMPNYACAVVAILPSHVLQRVGRRLRQAQDMGSYHLVELLGRGGMGEVWRAEHQLLARSAAIKLVRPELLGASTDAEARMMLRRFEREAQATAALSSPHTIRVFDFGVTADRTFYYVMELLDGRDLDSLVREFGPVPADRTLFLLAQVCHSLADAHARGLVHRDITPANIYTCRMGLDYDFVKVLDFGLVKVSDRSTMQTTLMTGAHTTTGTPAFMAPEIILNEGEVDQRADVYALGCVAYYLLTGQLVFEADSPMKMFLQHMQESPIPPSQRSELHIPREVDDLVLACLEKDPAKRPQSADLLLRMVRQCRSGESWDHDTARGWWQTHLSELTGPLTMSDMPSGSADRTFAVQ